LPNLKEVKMPAANRYRELAAADPARRRAEFSTKRCSEQAASCCRQL